MENEMVTPTYSKNFTVILISFLLDVRESVYSPNVEFSDSYSTDGLCHLWNQLFGTLRIQMMILLCFGRSLHGKCKKILTILPIADGKMTSFRKTSFLWGNLFVLILPATNYWLEDGKHCLWETGSTYLFIFCFTGMFSIIDFITVYYIDDLVKTIHLYTESFWITM